jgi:hypothetical protein
MAARWQAIRADAIARGEVVADPDTEGHVQGLDWWHA